MSQTLTRLLVHAVFSTKNREQLLSAALEPGLFAFIGGIGKAHDSPVLIAGAADDHVHLLISISKNISVAGLMMHIKKDSSRWAKTAKHGAARFGWQDGYAAFTIGESQLPALRTYFAKQRDRHYRTSFQDELRALCRRYKVALDERYAWD